MQSNPALAAAAAVWRQWLDWIAPVVIKDIYAALPQIKESGASVIVVEQDIGQAMAVADRVYCMMEGRVTLEGTPESLSRDDIHAAYFGVSA